MTSHSTSLRPSGPARQSCESMDLIGTVAVTKRAVNDNAAELPRTIKKRRHSSSWSSGACTRSHSFEMKNIFFSNSHVNISQLWFETSIAAAAMG